MSGTPGKTEASPVWRALLLAVLIVDAVLLAILELFYLPLRLDGVILPRLGDVPVPVTMLLAATTTPLLVLQAARLGRARVAMLPFLVWFLTLVVLGVFGPGRDRVLLLDWRGLLLLAGGALPAAMVLGGVLGRRSTTTTGVGRYG